MRVDVRRLPVMYEMVDEEFTIGRDEGEGGMGPHINTK